MADLFGSSWVTSEDPHVDVDRYVVVQTMQDAWAIWLPEEPFYDLLGKPYRNFLSLSNRTPFMMFTKKYIAEDLAAALNLGRAARPASPPAEEPPVRRIRRA